ncbi:MAG: tyrosine-type recombinase/integrase [Phycisphaerales bacterium JB060]
MDDPKRWQVKVFLRRDANGRKIYRSEVVHGGKKAAEARLLELLQAKSGNALKPRSKVTLRDAAEEWLTHKAHQVAPRTLDQYRQALERYVLPVMGHRRVSDLELREIDQLYHQMLDGSLPTAGADSRRSGRGLSARTVRITHTALNQVLKQAVRWKYVQTNVAAEATLPQVPEPEKASLSRTERTRFLQACEQSFYGAFYACMLDTGLRPGEACALKWDDVDFDLARIRVNRAVTKGENGEAVDGPGKTKKSKRTVPMVPQLARVLLGHHQCQSERGFLKQGYVFTNMAGERLRPWTFSNKDLAATVRRAGISKKLSLYSLRHTFADLHVLAGTSMKIVSTVMGHSSIQQTGDTYMKGDVSASEHWMQRYGEFLDAGGKEERPLPN